jgi:hypothetical protein
MRVMLFSQGEAVVTVDLVTWYRAATASCSMPPSLAAFAKATMGGMSATRLSEGPVGRLKPWHVASLSCCTTRLIKPSIETHHN